MTEYINKREAEKLICAKCDASPCPFDCPSITALKEKSSITIVRCKDCKHKDYRGFCGTVLATPPDDFFCAKGEEQ